MATGDFCPLNIMAGLRPGNPSAVVCHPANNCAWWRAGRDECSPVEPFRLGRGGDPVKYQAKKGTCPFCHTMAGQAEIDTQAGRVVICLHCGVRTN